MTRSFYCIKYANVVTLYWLNFQRWLSTWFEVTPFILVLIEAINGDLVTRSFFEWIICSIHSSHSEHSMVYLMHPSSLSFSHTHIITWFTGLTVPVFMWDELVHLFHSPLLFNLWHDDTINAGDKLRQLFIFFFLSSRCTFTSLLYRGQKYLVGSSNNTWRTNVLVYSVTRQETVHPAFTHVSLSMCRCHWIFQLRSVRWVRVSSYTQGGRGKKKRVINEYICTW